MSERTQNPRISLQQPGRDKAGISPRDFVELSKKVSELSDAVSAGTRPQLSARFIDKEEGTDNTIDLVTTQLNGVTHGLGRAYRGWCLAGINADAIVREATAAEVTQYNVDTTVYLPLFTTANVTIKLLVW